MAIISATTALTRLRGMVIAEAFAISCIAGRLQMKGRLPASARQRHYEALHDRKLEREKSRKEKPRHREND